MTIVRWILVLPAAILAGAIITVPMSMLLMMNFNSESMSLPLSPIYTVDGLPFGFFYPVFFILAGSRTAPKFQFAVSCILSAIMLGLKTWARVVTEDWIWYGILLNVVALVGSPVIAFLKFEEKRSGTIVTESTAG